MLMAALVAGALACLLLGLVLDEIVLTYAALGVSLLGIAMLFAAKVWKRRTLPSGDLESRSANQYGSVRPTPLDGAVDPLQPERLRAEPETNEADAEPSSGVSASDGAESGIEDLTETPVVHVVHVVRGRRRYHVAACRLLNGHPDEPITVEEAHEEGFTACTTCVPDSPGPDTNLART
jgi:hypothetical protein